MRDYFDEHIWEETKLQKITTEPKDSETDKAETSDDSALEVESVDTVSAEPVLTSTPTENAPPPAIKLPKKKSRLPVIAACLVTGLVGIALGFSAVGFVTGYNEDARENRVAAFTKEDRIPTSPEDAEREKEVAFKFTENTAPTASVAYTAAAGYDIPGAIAKVEDAVVSINATSLSTQYFLNRSFTEESPSAGSGVVFHEDADKVYIATNNHVIDAAKSVSISFDDSMEVPASYVGSNADHDLAVVSVLKSDLQAKGIDEVTVAEFGDSDALAMGQTVIAIGNALGEGKSATLGIVSAVDKTITFDDGTAMEYIQTDAAINPGNSGGPLIDTNSKVVGINSAKYSDYAVEGMGFSIPVSTAKQVLEDIMTGSAVQTPFLGIRGGTVTEELKQYHPMPDGVIVTEVIAGGSADSAGIQIYDVITEFNGTVVTSMEGLQELIGASKVGDHIMATVYRDSRDMVIQITITDQNATKF